jgi:hypothetical protein
MHAGFLFELASRCGQQIFTRLRYPLGYGPRADITAFPERATWMGEKELQAIRRPAVQQQARTLLGRRQEPTRRAQK